MLESYEIQDLLLVQSEHIRSWTVALMRSQKSNKTINRKIASIKSFYKFLELQTEEELKNPTRGVITPKKQQRLPNFIKSAEIEALLNAFDDKDDFIKLRNKMIIELLYATGIRRSELMNLTIQNIEFQQHFIKVMGKGAKERIIPIHPTLAEHLKTYWKLRNTTFEMDNNYYAVAVRCSTGYIGEMVSSLCLSDVSL